MIEILRRWLTIGILAVGLVVGLQISSLLRQAANTLDHVDSLAVDNGVKIASVLTRLDGILGRIDETVRVVRKSADHQVGYYEGIGRRSQNAVAKLEILITNLNERTERITQSFETLAADSSEVAEQTTAELANLGNEVSLTLAEARTVLGSLNALAADPALAASAASMERASAEAAVATENVAEATGYIRDALKPTKKSFWQWVLGIIIPKPTIGLGN